MLGENFFSLFAVNKIHWENLASLNIYLMACTLLQSLLADNVDCSASEALFPNSYSSVCVD